jgi:hypothetical protein
MRNLDRAARARGNRDVTVDGSSGIALDTQISYLSEGQDDATIAGDNLARCFKLSGLAAAHPPPQKSPAENRIDRVSRLARPTAGLRQVVRDLVRRHPFLKGRRLLPCPTAPLTKTNLS